MEPLRYVGMLSWPQDWMAVETVDERVLVCTGHARAIPWTGTLDNLLRVPLALALALPAGHGAEGAW